MDTVSAVTSSGQVPDSGSGLVKANAKKSKKANWRGKQIATAPTHAPAPAVVKKPFDSYGSMTHVPAFFDAAEKNYTHEKPVHAVVKKQACSPDLTKQPFDSYGAMTYVPAFFDAVEQNYSHEKLVHTQVKEEVVVVVAVEKEEAKTKVPASGGLKERLLKSTETAQKNAQFLINVRLTEAELLARQVEKRKGDLRDLNQELGRIQADTETASAIAAKSTSQDSSEKGKTLRATYESALSKIPDIEKSVEECIRNLKQSQEAYTKRAASEGALIELQEKVGFSVEGYQQIDKLWREQAKKWHKEELDLTGALGIFKAKRVAIEADLDKLDPPAATGWFW